MAEGEEAKTAALEKLIEMMALWECDRFLTILLSESEKKLGYELLVQLSGQLLLICNIIIMSLIYLLIVINIYYFSILIFIFKI